MAGKTRAPVKTSAPSRKLPRINADFHGSTAKDLCESAQIRGPLRFVSQPCAGGHSPAQGDTGKAMGREYFVPGFSDGKDHDAYRAAFDRVPRDLRAEEPLR